MGKSFEWWRAACSALGAAAMLAPLGAAAQSSADDWQFRGTIYGWLPSIKGNANFPTPQGSIQVNTDTILDNLQFAFMGTLEAHKGRWGAFTDVIYFDFSGSKAGATPFTVGGVPPATGAAFLNADMSLNGWVWTLAGEYAAIQDPAHPLNLFAGFRYLTVSTDFSFAFLGDVGTIPVAQRAGAVSASADIWDAIVGVHGTLKLGDGGWFLPYYLDIGTGGSKFTWQALAGVAYQFKWGDVVAAYRYLDYNLSDSKALSDMTMYGPLIGVTFRW